MHPNSFSVMTRGSVFLEGGFVMVAVIARTVQMRKTATKVRYVKTMNSDAIQRESVFQKDGFVIGQMTVEITPMN